MTENFINQKVQIFDSVKPVGQEPRSAVEFVLVSFDLALEDTVVVGVHLVELQLSLSTEVAVPLSSGETPNLSVDFI